ncbi:MAG: hypothetical protein IPQ18_13700 [Saprospiraceae bacterium]|nr:hypothetical protein [Saprospiraceae bacterium]
MAKWSYPQKSVYTINNGIDTTSYSNLSIRHQKKIEAIKYLFVTNDFKEDVKVDLVFLEKLINTGVEVHLIGANSPFEENNVHNYGYLSDKNKYLSILNNTDVMLFFSTIDNYPTVIIEGLCAGLHIAGYRSKGIEEVTNNFCKNVTFFSSYETFCKIDIVSKLTTEKITTSEEAIKYFSAKKMIKSYLKLYDAN